MYRCLDSDFEGNPKPSKRGKYERSKLKQEAVKSHILSYNPTVSHYRRAHAPNRYYLPSDLTGVSMYTNYQDSAQPDLKVNYSFYSNVMLRMNISLVKLGHEQCEACVAATLHQSASGHIDEDNFIAICSLCKSHMEHLRLASSSRLMYRADGDNIRTKEIVFAVDLQKVQFTWNVIFKNIKSLNLLYFAFMHLFLITGHSASSLRRSEVHRFCPALISI